MEPAEPSSVLALAPADGSRRLTAVEFRGLEEVLPEVEWFNNLTNPCTRRAYQGGIREFMGFIGIVAAGEVRKVTRSHVLAWRKELEGRGLAGATIRRKLSAVASLFDHLCESNAVTHNPLRGVQRPRANAGEGKTPAIGDGQARALLNSPNPETLKGKRDRAILAVLLYHGLRRAELCALKVRDLQDRRGVRHLRVHGKGDKIRFVPAHPAALARVEDYLEAAGHREDTTGALFRPVRNNRSAGKLGGALTADGVYKAVVCRYAREAGISGLEGFRAARVAGDGGHQRAGPRGRHRQGAGVAGTRGHFDDPSL